MFSLTTFLLTATIMLAEASASDIKNLMKAVQGRNIDKVKELLNTVEIDGKDELGLNVLHAAVHSSGEITRLLISHGAGKLVNDHTQIGISSPLFHACFFHSHPHMYEIMEAMLKAGGDPNISDSTLRTRTPLHYITTGPEARLLISYGANVNAKDKEGYTPAAMYFIRPFHQKDQEILHALADGHADFTITNDFSDTIFHIKSDRNPVTWTKELVTFLARNGVPADAFNNRGETALTKLLKRDLLLSNNFGIVPDGIAYENLKDSFYAHMAEAGASLNAPNRHGETLLHLAVLNCRAGMAKWLLENGADVEAKNADGLPPLLALAKREERNHAESDRFYPGTDKADKMKAVIDVLVEGGADVGFLDEAGHNAAYYLREWDINLLNPENAEPGPSVKSFE